LQVSLNRKPPVPAATELPRETKAKPELNPAWRTAVRAAEAKKATDFRVLDIREVTSMSDCFVICTGMNPRQNQAIADEIETELKKIGERPHCVEGYESAEWILMDYGDFLIHIFTDKTRKYYDLERMYRSAKDLEVPADTALEQ
jgi:ribosome-associated protein